MICCMLVANSWAELAGAMFTILAGCWTLWQWRKDQREHCADVYGQLLSTFTESDIFHAFEELIDKEGINDLVLSHDRKRRDERFEKIDKVLLFLNQVCYLNENKMLGEKEFQAFRYPLLRTLQNEKILEYIEGLRHEFCNEFMYDSLMAFAGSIDEENNVGSVEHLSNAKWRAYLIKHYGGWTHTAQSVYARVNAVCLQASVTIDGLVATVDVANKHVEDVAKLFSDKSAAQISSLRTAVRHCCMAKHGVWPEN